MRKLLRTAERKPVTEILINLFSIGFLKRLWYKMSHLTGMPLFCKEFTFEIVKIMKLALNVFSVWLNLSWF